MEEKKFDLLPEDVKVFLLENQKLLEDFIRDIEFEEAKLRAGVNPNQNIE
jgi:hypothetical protein